MSHNYLTYYNNGKIKNVPYVLTFASHYKIGPFIDIYGLIIPGYLYLSFRVQVYYLGKDGCGLSRVTSMSMDTITHRGMVTLHMSDPTLFKPLSSIAVLPASESSTLHLLAITSSGKVWL